MRSRHELVWLTPLGWAQAQAQAAPSPGDQPTPAQRVLVASVARWCDNNLPLVACRREPNLSATQLRLGLPMPPDADGSKLRFAFTLEEKVVARSQAPITLAEAAQGAPVRWREPLQALLADCTRAAAALPAREGHAPLLLRVFGSLAMQALTGLDYLRAGSDLDLLLYPRSVAELRAGLAVLRRHAAALPLDGEIVFADGGAVAWREFEAAGLNDRVLVKSSAGVQLQPRAQLLASLGPA